MREPPRHVARLYPFRAMTTRANTISVRANPAPPATGIYTSPPSPNPSATPTPPESNGIESARIDGSPPRATRPAVTSAPSQASKVPSIHQIGRYHQVLPPPTASHVHG